MFTSTRFPSTARRAIPSPASFFQERAVLGLRLAQYALGLSVFGRYSGHHRADSHEEKEPEGTHGKLRGGNLEEYGVPQRPAVEEVVVHHGVDQLEGEAGKGRSKERAVSCFHDPYARLSQRGLGALSVEVPEPHVLPGCRTVLSRSAEVKDSRQGGGGFRE